MSKPRKVQINTNQETITGTRMFRQSGSSVIVTIPPEVMQSLNIDMGDECRITASWDTDEITIEPL